MSDGEVEPVIEVPRQVFDRVHLLLAAITAIAGIIRFYHLNHPSLWFDESMVFRRTCGSYEQLLDCLRTDGFVPLHYSLVWLVSRGLKLTPFVLRFIPALCGTLMVPAVYFLARQMLDRATCLLAAGFTACSAFMLFYSRDAKMYMDAWLMVTLNAGSLLWWFRSRSTTAWLCWIASGCAACGIHFSSAIPIAISVLLLFTQRKLHWKQSILWLVGAIVIFSGPVGYYEKFNRWQDRVDQDGWRDSGLRWIGAYNYGRGGPELLRVTGTSMMMGWEWPRPADLQVVPEIRFVWPARGAIALLILLGAACLPWPQRWRHRPMPIQLQSHEPDLSAILDPAQQGRFQPIWKTSREPQWRVALWLGFWILLPLYGFYARSVTGFDSPLDWWGSAVGRFPWLGYPLEHHWLLIAIGLLLGVIPALTDFFPRWRLAVFRCGGLLIVAATMLGILQIMAIAMAAASRAATESGNPWQSLWVPRYMGFIWPMVAIAVAALLMRFPTRAARAIAIVLVLGINLTIGSLRVLGQTEPPIDRMASDAFAAEDANQHTLFWSHLNKSQDSPGGGNINGEPGVYYLQILENKPMDPVKFRAAVLDRHARDPGLWRWPWTRPIRADVNRIILWTEYRADGSPIMLRESPLPAGWALQSEEWFTARDCWIYRDLARYRRAILIRR